MSLFQCGHCGCCENTALSFQGCHGSYPENVLDWSGFEDRKGKKLCSACAPIRFSDGTPSGLGKWHGKFERVYLPGGMFRTARNGNLEHIETGDQDFERYALPTTGAGS